ncbi:hypothetical protein GOBAR_DD30844 [Gossypium barbadense]|nr:hypothetical protein GOBAR_DD30844 [Gossypium barbadense]
MANASGFFTPSVPRLRSKIQPSIGVSRSGFCFSAGISRRVVCSSAIEGAEKHVSPSESRMPKLVSKGCKLVGCGSAVPSLSVSNDDLSKIVDTSDEWISVRTGIRNRRVMSGKESLKKLAVEAARKALEMADFDPNDLDLILMCTSTPEDIFGSAPQTPKAIQSNIFTFVNYRRGTCILFGDAAGAVLVQYFCLPVVIISDHKLLACDAEEDGLLSFDLHSDGEGGRHLGAPINDNETDELLGSNGSALDFPPKKSSYSCIQMNGKEVFRFAVRCVPQSIESALEKAGLVSGNVDWLLLHQANQRIIDAVATRLDFPQEKVISNLANYGNTSAASIPLALDEAVRSGKVKPGHTIAAAGFGAGLTWGSAIIRWG